MKRDPAQPLKGPTLLFGARRWWTSVDVWLLVGCVVALAGHSLWMKPASDRSTADGPAVGEVVMTIGDVRFRRVGAFVWQRADLGRGVAHGDSIYVPAAASASVSFEGGTLLGIEERSLVVVRPELAGTRHFELRRGSVRGTTNSTPLSLAAGGGVVDLAAGSAARVAIGAQQSAAVEVWKGEAAVESAGKVATLRRQQRVELSADGELGAVTDLDARLLEPARGDVVYFDTQVTDVTLSWTAGPAPHRRVEVAIHRDFSADNIIVAGAYGATEVVAKALGHGLYWWRVVDRERVQRSETRALRLYRDVPPAPLYPISGEPVFARHQRVPFVWSGLQDTLSYEVEIARGPACTEAIWQGRVRPPQLVVDWTFEPGAYCWRVRGGDRDAAPMSMHAEFFVTAEPVLPAPKLHEATLGVTKGRNP